MKHAKMHADEIEQMDVMHTDQAQSSIQIMSLIIKVD